MKIYLYFLTTIFTTSAIAGISEENPFYLQAGYLLKKLSEARRTDALAPLSANEIFKRMRGLERSCEAIYHLTDSAGQSVGYGSICKTSHENERVFFCWDATGQHLGFSREPYGADPAWIGDSILHDCGGKLVRDTDRATYGSDPMAESTMPELGWGERRPVLTMLKSDIKDLGFDISLGHCGKIRYIWLGREKNTSYGAICEIDETGKKALICFDHLIGHFGLVTRHEDNSTWVKHTISRHCWGG